MQIDRQTATIELTEQETEWFFNSSSEVPAEALHAHEDIYYKTFKDKVEHTAKEMYHAYPLTIVIYAENRDDEIALCAENGIEICVNVTQLLENTIVDNNFSSAPSKKGTVSK